LTKKTHCNGKLFEHTCKIFLLIYFQFLLLFKLVVIFVTFHLMLKGLEVIFLKMFFDYWGGKGCGLMFLIYIYYWRGTGGVEVSFFLFHLTCGRGKGGGLIIFLKTFFSLLRGLVKGEVMVFFLLICWRGMGEGGGWFFKRFIMGGLGVGLTNSILSKLN
jgi:hypothetical protein